MINDLVFTTPEEQGISSANVLKFIEILEYNKINIHSFLMARKGKIFAEGYVKPFNEDFRHRIYSSSKSIVSLAVGKLITQGKIKYSDKICELLSSLIDTELGYWSKQTTVLDALTMSEPSIPARPENSKEGDKWAYNRLNKKVDKRPPGTIFSYGGGADTLAVVVEKITGKNFLEYLRPEFDAIGVSKDIWCVKAPDGYAWGGSGVVCTLRDFAKIGEFFMNKGSVNGKQLIDRNYMEKATTCQISNLNSNSYSPLRTGGYGYLVWITPEGFAFRGMGSQLVFCFPDKEILFACQADTQKGDTPHSDVIYQAFKYLIYDDATEKKVDSGDYLRLKEKLHNLLAPSYGVAHSVFEKQINGVKYILEENPLGWQYFKFDFNENEGVLTYKNKRGEKKLKFGCAHQIKGTFPETHYYDVKKGVPANRQLNCLSVLEWMAETSILLRVYITDTSFGNLFINFSFKGDEVGVCANKCAEFFLDDYEGIFGGRKEK